MNLYTGFRVLQIEIGVKGLGGGIGLEDLYLTIDYKKFIPHWIWIYVLKYIRLGSLIYFQLEKYFE